MMDYFERLRGFAVMALSEITIKARVDWHLKKENVSGATAESGCVVASSPLSLREIENIFS